MPQIFSPRSNTLFRLVLLLAVLGAAGTGVFGITWKWSSYETEVNMPSHQPVPFSHQHHVAGLGLDCRYCHTSVEKTATAGMPPSKTCMTCHSQIWQQASMLQPVRDSFAKNIPLEWNRVYKLPKYVYFNHSIHVNKGIGCTSCHGAIDRMPLTWKVKPFYMKDCLACHREPERSIRPKAEVFSQSWQPSANPAEQLDRGKKLVEEYHIPMQRLTDCYTCHR
jgi:hypothetical protein